MDPITTHAPTASTLDMTVERPHHGACLTQDVTNFLLSRASMDEVSQFCVLTALAPLHPWQMAVYAVGTDSLFRIVGSFGKGSGLDVLHQYSCLDDPQVGAELRNGNPLATFPLVGMRPEQHLNISDLNDGPQVLWPLSTAHGLIGVIHLRYAEAPPAETVTRDMAAIAGPIALALDLAQGRDPVSVAAGFAGAATTPDMSLAHPSLLGPATPTTLPRALSVVRWGGSEAKTAPTAPPNGDLTARQLRVLSLMAKGMTNGQIARVLAFSESTVRQETMAIYRNLQVKGRAEAIDYGRSHGLIPTSP